MKNLKNVLILLILVGIGTACKKKTASGFSYTVHKTGTGAKANIGDLVAYDVLLYKDDSLMFSTITEGQPARSPCEDPKEAKDAFYKLTMEALSLLKVGDSASFLMPLDTFKVKPQGLDGAKSAKMVFVIRNIKSKADVDKRQKELQELTAAITAMKPALQARAKAVTDSATAFAKDFGAGKLPANIKELPSGLKIAILTEGTGNLPKKGEVVLVNYYGSLKDGKKFDESFSRGEPISFPVGAGQVIPGWDEGLMQIKEGTRAVFFIPAKLGYGDRPMGETIPANSDLVFYIELMKSVDVN